MLDVRTGSRLHFGLMELAAGEPLRYAGLGLMLDEPGWVIRMSSAKSPLSVSRPGRWGFGGKPYGDEQQNELRLRIAKFLGFSETGQGCGDTACLCVDVLRELPLHCGLGSGTQLAAALAVGKHLLGSPQCSTTGSEPEEEYSEPEEAFSEAAGEWLPCDRLLPDLDTVRLAQLSGRGLRSAVGLHGFLHGGFILDEGYAGQAHVREISSRSVALPADWWVVLMCPDLAERVSGELESKRLARIAQRPNPHKQEMFGLASGILDRLALHHEVPTNAAPAEAFSDVMHMLEEYMLLAARLFEQQQGGLYNGVGIATAVAAAQRVGLRGVGQSSWGPTVFGFASDRSTADACLRELRLEFPSPYGLRIASPARGGAQCRRR